MPTAAFRTYSNGGCWPCENQGEAVNVPVNLSPGTYPAGTVLGELTATPGTYRDYGSGHGDGSAVARGILQYAVVVDASGNYWLGDTSGASEHGVPGPKYANMWRNGVFKTADLVGWDATAFTTIGAKIKTGTNIAGVIVITAE